MLKEFNILTKVERMNSNREGQQNAFKITSNNVLQGNSQFQYSKKQTIEDDLTDHQSFHYKAGYSISEDLNFSEKQKQRRNNSTSIEQHYGRRITSRQSQGQSTTTRNQSLEHCLNTEQQSSQRDTTFNTKIIRKTFNFDESEVQKEFQSDNDNTTKHLQTKNSTKSFKSQTSTIKLSSILKVKFKRIRRCFTIIKALFRMKSLCNQKEAAWKTQISILQQNQKTLKYNESITVIKIKQWTQMVFSKMISLIQQKGLEKQKLDFIDQQLTQLEKDMAIVLVSNIFTFSMSNLMVMTSSSNLLPELCLIMHQDQYQNYRKQFSKLVSERVNYITKENQYLEKEQKELILTECIVINNLIPSLIKLTSSLDALKCGKPSIEFLVRCMISLLHHFFIDKFIDYPKVQPQSNIKYSQHQLGRNSQTLILNKVENGSTDQLIIGTYTTEQLKPILEKKSWYDSNKKKMSQVAQNLLFHY